MRVRVRSGHRKEPPCPEPGLPTRFTIGLGGVWSNVSALEYLRKQWNRTDSTDGDITSYAVTPTGDATSSSSTATAGSASASTRAAPPTEPGPSSSRARH
ncbi:hypothetical protein ALMP_79160 [Streptomyces sp. A012304]|nr:hypothetical protein ALMP_79160 [Streptomyces sp. A012304]